MRESNLETGTGETSLPDSAAETGQETGTESGIEPASEGMTDTDAEPTPEGMTDTDAEPAPEGMTDTDAEPTPEGMTDTDAEPASEGMTDTDAEPASEDQPDGSMEPTSEGQPEQNQDSGIFYDDTRNGTCYVVTASSLFLRSEPSAEENDNISFRRYTLFFGTGNFTEDEKWAEVYFFEPESDRSVDAPLYTGWVYSQDMLDLSSDDFESQLFSMVGADAADFAQYYQTWADFLTSKEQYFDCSDEWKGLEEIAEDYVSCQSEYDAQAQFPDMAADASEAEELDSIIVETEFTDSSKRAAGEASAGIRAAVRNQGTGAAAAEDSEPCMEEEQDAVVSKEEQDSMAFSDGQDSLFSPDAWDGLASSGGQDGQTFPDGQDNAVTSEGEDGLTRSNDQGDVPAEGVQEDSVQ